MNKVLLIGGAIAAYFLFIKPKSVTPTAPTTPAADAYNSMTDEQLDAAIDQWIAANPDKEFPADLLAVAQARGLLI